jgi:hypothetical protein
LSHPARNSPGARSGWWVQIIAGKSPIAGRHHRSIDLLGVAMPKGFGLVADGLVGPGRNEIGAGHERNERRLVAADFGSEGRHREAALRGENRTFPSFRPSFAMFDQMRFCRAVTPCPAALLRE